MGDNNELGSLFSAVGYIEQKGKLSLGRKGGFGLVEYIYSIGFELILCNCKEAFSMDETTDQLTADEYVTSEEVLPDESDKKSISENH